MFLFGWCALCKVSRYNREQTCEDGQSDESIVTASLEGKGCHQGQSDQDSTDAGQQMKRRHAVGRARQSTELICASPGHWL